MFYTSVIKNGSKILHRYIDDHGNARFEKENYEPTLYLRTTKPTNWKTLKGVPVEPKKFANIWEARNFADGMRDVRPDVVHGIADFDLTFIHEKYPGVTVTDFSKIRAFFVDIEVHADRGVFPKPEEALDAVNAITIYDTIKKKYYIFSTLLPSFKSHLPTLYVPCKDERELLTAFVSFWSRDYPDIGSGWNSNGFDFPYLINRISNLFGEQFAQKLSPWNKITARKGKNSYGQECTVYDILGVELLDYLDLYKKFTIKNQESYKLDFIAEIEVGEKKIDFEGSLVDLANNDPLKFIEYNQHDVQLLVKMEAKLQLLNTCTTVAYLLKCNYSDALGTVRPWTSKIASDLLAENTVIDCYHRPMEDRTFEAAYVKEPIPGMYDVVATLDATSMYPHMQMGFNISPEKKVDSDNCPEELRPYFMHRHIESIEAGNLDIKDLLKKYDMCIAPNGQLFRRDGPGIIPRVISELFAQRKAKKSEMLRLKRLKEAGSDDPNIEAEIRSLDVMQNSIKVAMNSLFGCAGNKHFPLFDIHLAEAITFGGQAGIRFVARRISEYITKLVGRTSFKDYVIYIDTDSLAINMSDIVNKFGYDPTNIDLLCKIADTKLTEVAEKACQEYADTCNMMWTSLQFKREKIATSGVYVKKKKYFLYVHDSEGVRYAEPDLAITGLETNRSSTPKFIRDALTESIMYIIRKDEVGLQEFVARFRDVYMDQELLTLAMPRSVNDMEKYSNKQTIYGMRCPIAVRAALLHNHLVAKLGLEGKYQPIKSGEKMRFIFLTLPNPLRENVVGFIDKLPPEFNLEPYLDKDEMFIKSFIDPLQKICNVINWNTEPVNNLSAFF